MLISQSHEWDEGTGLHADMRPGFWGHPRYANKVKCIVNKLADVIVNIVMV